MTSILYKLIWINFKHSHVITLRQISKLNNEVNNSKSFFSPKYSPGMHDKAMMIKASGSPNNIIMHMAEGIIEQLFRRDTQKYN